MYIPKLKSWFTQNKDKINKIFLILLSIFISLSIIIFRDSLAHLQSYGLVGIFLISIVGNATIVIPAPVILSAFIGGSIYNPIVVGLIVALGATLGELTGYLAGLGGRVAITDHRHFKKVEHWMTKSGFLTILVLAAVPNPLFDIAGIFAGATNYSTKKFLLATLIGKSIKFLTVALLGRTLF